LQTIAYFLNRVPSKFIDKISYEIWNDKRPNLLYLLRIWGCHAYVKYIVFEKLWAKPDNCKFVGYLKEFVGYYFYHPIEQKVFVSTFLEK